MKPYYQGKIDVFCAIYAVLNGLKITHHIRTLEARDIFHDTLMGLAQNSKVFRAVLDQQTDYVPLVDAMLNIQSKARPLRIERPYALDQAKEHPSSEQLWDTIEKWLKPNTYIHPKDLTKSPERAVIFRFLRYFMPGTEPANRHWTTAYQIIDDTLHFFDCSQEETAIYSITKEAFVTYPSEICTGKLCCIEPHSLRLMAPRGTKDN